MTVMTVSVILYKRLGISNTDIALYTSWLYFPWVIKPFWSPIVELLRTKRFWILTMELLIGASLACVAWTIPASNFFRYTLAFFWVMAFSSATHDIAADGFYMLGLKQDQQAAFVGVRTTFYRIATIVTKGGLVVLAGMLENRGWDIATAWSVAFFVIAVMFCSLFLYHMFAIPRPQCDMPVHRDPKRSIFGELIHSLVFFFQQKDILAVLAFFLFYRFAEAQLVKMVAPFLLDPRSKGGLGLSSSDVGIIYGTVGVMALMLGGLVGGYAVYRKGLKFCLWSMVFAMHLPDFVFIYLSRAMPENFHVINLAVAVEQFGYGFGFTAYTLVMIMVSEGPYKTVHYAIGTGFMALGMMVPAMFSGWFQEHLGYPDFFTWIILSTIPGFIVAAMVKIDPQFGKKP
jgi:PAT family beta-lactamase induction signal transducer AmpG